MRTRLTGKTLCLISAGLLAGLGACGDDDNSSSAASTATTAKAPTNPCAPEAPADETALEGDPAKPGAAITTVTAHEYRFEGIPATLPPGPHGFILKGAGKEFHELALVRVDDERPISDILELSEKEQEKVTEYIGGVTACPGTTSPEALGVDLTAGRYALVCFVPVGTTPELRGADLAAAYENAPHFAEGMVSEFSVQ